jgi:hypothetical protein
MIFIVIYIYIKESLNEITHKIDKKLQNYKYIFIKSDCEN